AHDGSPASGNRGSGSARAPAHPGPEEDLMARSISRSFYRCLLRLHPSAFRTRFADEMLWIFDEVAPREGVRGLFGDAFWSLARQWTVRVALSADSPYPATTPELFAWERIGSPSTSLPAPRIVQGGFVSLLFV